MTGRPRGRPRAKPLLSQDSSSISENISPISAESSLSSLLSSRDSSSSVSAASSYESVATVIHPSLSLVEDQVQQIEPLPPTPPRARSTASAQVEQLKQLAEEAKANDLDPTVLMFAQLLSNQSRPPPDKSSPLSKPIGEHKQGEDIFVFLHRFEYQMKLRHIPPINWLHYLPDLLHGEYSEAFYNNVTPTTSFSDMRTILLNAGVYSLNDCLQSFPLKFRTSGSKSPMQWFNHWKYKCGVILEHFTFLSELPDDQLELMAQSLAAIAVLAGMSSEARESVLNRGHTSVHSFMQDCSSLFSFAGSSHSRPR